MHSYVLSPGLLSPASAAEDNENRDDGGVAREAELESAVANADKRQSIPLRF